MRLVLDTSVIVSAFRSRSGASRRLIEAFDDNAFILLLSEALLLEYEDVLKRPKQMLVHRASQKEIDDFLYTLSLRAVKVTFHYRLRPQLRDPNDDMVLETAVNGIADFIVTHNVADFSPQTEVFGVRVLTPGDMIKVRLVG